MLQCFVPGVPQPQGSKQAFIRGNRAVLVEANKKLPSWRQSVTEALEAANVGCEPMQGALSATLTFFMSKPKSVKRLLPSVKPDIDKLCRAILDSGTNAGIYSDDSQIVELVALKLYADEFVPEGVLITIDRFIGES